MLKRIYGIEFYSNENCCYGYQIQINNQLMPVLFNFIVFSNTQNFLYFSEHEVVWSYFKLVEKIGGHHACLGDIVQNISKMGVFCSFLRGAWGEFYKSCLKSHKSQSFQLILPIVNLTV